MKPQQEVVGAMALEALKCLQEQAIRFGGLAAKGEHDRLAEAADGLVRPDVGVLHQLLKELLGLVQFPLLQVVLTELQTGAHAVTQVLVVLGPGVLLDQRQETLFFFRDGRRLGHRAGFCEHFLRQRSGERVLLAVILYQPQPRAGSQGRHDRSRHPENETPLRPVFPGLRRRTGLRASKGNGLKGSRPGR